MQKLEGHWVAKRIGILEHYKGMTLPEIVLFDTYLLLSNKQTWECWRTVRQLAEILPMKKDSVFRAKKSLLDKGWIVEIDRTGVFIPKLFRYVDEDASVDQILSQDQDSLSRQGERLSRLGVQTSHDDKKGLSRLGVQTYPHMRQLSRPGVQLVSFGGTIIDEDDIIENNILSISTNSDMPSPPEVDTQQPDDKDKGLTLERRYLNLLKSIPGYPFNFEKDLPFIRDLLVDFPALDLAMEIKDWKTWLMDKRLKGKINYRSRLRRWVKNSIKYKEKDDGKRSIQGRRPNDQGTGYGRKGFDRPSSYPVDAGGINDGTSQGKAKDDGDDNA
jgi:hypothetical protein